MSENIQKMKTKFLVGTSQCQLFFPLSRSKDPMNPCQSDWIPLEYLWVSVSLYPALQQDGLLSTVPHLSVPTHHLKHETWGAGIMGIKHPRCHVPSRTACQLSVMPHPSGNNTLVSSSFLLYCCMSDIFPD